MSKQLEGAMAIQKSISRGKRNKLVTLLIMFLLIASVAQTSPLQVAAANVVLVGAGDISTCSNNNDEATAKLLDAIPGTVFVAGDNVYSSGTYTEYLNCYDPTWGRHKARTNPVPGNHEYATSGAAGYFQYFNNVPAFYAYNLGAWRI